MHSSGRAIAAAHSRSDQQQQQTPADSRNRHCASTVLLQQHVVPQTVIVGRPHGQAAISVGSCVGGGKVSWWLFQHLLYQPAASHQQ
jgi:hypothetical protein